MLVIWARFGLITKPLCEKTRSTGAELAGTHKICSNSGRMLVNLSNRKFIKATRPRHMRTRPMLHEAEAEAEAEATKFGLEATLASRT